MHSFRGYNGFLHNESEVGGSFESYRYLTPYSHLQELAGRLLVYATGREFVSEIGPALTVGFPEFYAILGRY
ncbi:hypothetical protein [Ureibacillus chungkukjangi]|uniref:hypothetical protein n=1 Tax=Ureibacillus chungkukjangi TaxID=1202712 RepID=UPI0020421482|nr:hypothetical protein [Ureibacillus chungkukjangi]